MAAAPEPDVLVELACEVAGAAGDLLLDGLLRRREVLGTKTSPTDLVTEWDHRSEALIAERLMTARPDDGLIAEEGSSRQGTSGVVWVVDPLDGTTNFLYGIPGFAVSVAAAVDRTVVAGVVADPLHGELYSASLGGGARRNGIGIEVSPHRGLSTALVATGFSYDAGRRRRQAQVLTQILPRVRDIRRGGAAAVDLCWVACGRVDGFWERGLAPWDHSAGALIAAEAGAEVSDLAGGPPSSEMVVAATPGIQRELLELLESSGAANA